MNSNTEMTSARFMRGFFHNSHQIESFDDNERWFWSLYSAQRSLWWRDTHRNEPKEKHLAETFPRLLLQAMRVSPLMTSARPLLDIARDTRMCMDDRIYHVLLGDSSPENIELFERALCSCPSFELAHTVATICGVVSYLAASGNFVDKQRFPQPDLVLLDLNLSGRRSGFEVLNWI